MKKSIILVIILITALNLNASQKNFNNWIFGDGVWIKFPDDVSDPYFVERAAINQVEGCATYSDDDGNMLFYTDGVTVWNNKHQVITNGTNLKGSWTSSQGAFFIPIPKTKDKLYLICIGSTENPNEHIYYSILDYSNGYSTAEIIDKNIEFNNTYNGERATAIIKPNKTGYWLILDDVAFPKYLVYDVNENGIQLHSTFNGKMKKQDNHGVVKISKNSNLIISVDSDFPEFEISRFNPFIGEVYDSKVFQSDQLGKTVHGADFSPNNKFIYISSNKKVGNEFITILNQCDVIKTLQTNSAVLSNIVWEPFNWRIASKEAVQIAPNNKIYIASPETNYLSCINKPNLKYPDCEYIKKTVDLKTTTSKLGLPSLTIEPEINYTFKDTTICENSEFTYKSEISDLSYWITPNKGVLTSEELKILNFSSIDSGYYHAYSENNELKEILKVKIINSKDIRINSNNNINNCEGDTVTLYISEKSLNPIWSTGDTTDSIKVTKSGIYYVDIVGNGTQCTATDSIEVMFQPRPKPIIEGEHQVFSCKNTEIELRSQLDHYTYKWLDENNKILSYQKSVKISESGKFRLIVSNEFGCFDTTDFYNVDFIKDSNVLLINYSNIDTFEFDTLRLNQLKCKELSIKNNSDKPFKITNLKLKDKYFFSLAPSQFPLLIEPFETKEIRICFKGDSIGKFEDILEIEDNCDSKLIKLKAIVENEILKGISKCDVEWSFVPISLSNGYTFKTSLPFPNPTYGKINLGYIEFKNSNEINPEISIYDSRGNYIANLQREVKTTVVYENGKLEKGNYYLESNLKSGIYFIKIQTVESSKFYSIIIQK